MTRVLVTGCHGFLGGAFARRAALRGWELTGVGRASQPPAGWTGGFETLDLAEDDLIGVLERRNPDLVFHAAGSASVATSFAAPISDLRASVVTFSRVLDAARRATRKPLVVFPSSAAVFGRASESRISEASDIKPISPYGFHKAACELVAAEYRECFGVPSTAVRIFSTFGPTQQRLLVWELFSQAITADVVTLQGSGQELRDYLHVDELCDAIADVAITESPPERVNIASGKSVSTLRLAELVIAAVGVDKPIRCLDTLRSGDPERWEANVSNLQRLIPRTFRPLDAALTDCISAWNSNTPPGQT